MKTAKWKGQAGSKLHDESRSEDCTLKFDRRLLICDHFAICISDFNFFH